MRHSIVTSGRALFAAGVALALGAGPTKPADNLQVTHTVVAGESISLICIDYYGYYSDALGKAVVALNPSVKNVDLIYAGQILSLRTPQESTAPPATAPKTVAPATTAASDAPGPAVASAEEPVFVKKMSLTQGVVTCVEGEAKWRRSVAVPSLPLKINTVVAPGNVIETGGSGRVEIIINREAVVRIRENSRVVLEEFRSASGGADKTRVGCGVGTIWTKMKKFRDRISRFELELPTAIAGVHGTVYETAVAPDSASEVKVFSGEVAVRSAEAAAQTVADVGGPIEVAGPQEVAPPQEVSMEHWTRIVRSMQKLSIDKKGNPAASVGFAEDRASDWEKWNRERDKRIAALFEEQER